MCTHRHPYSQIHKLRLASLYKLHTHTIHITHTHIHRQTQTYTHTHRVTDNKNNYLTLSLKVRFRRHPHPRTPHPRVSFLCIPCTRHRPSGFCLFVLTRSSIAQAGPLLGTALSLLHPLSPGMKECATASPLSQ